MVVIFFPNPIRHYESLFENPSVDDQGQKEIAIFPIICDILCSLMYSLLKIAFFGQNRDFLFSLLMTDVPITRSSKRATQTTSITYPKLSQQLT